MNTVIWVSAVLSALGVLIWLAALIWAARQDGRFARAYAKATGETSAWLTETAFPRTRD
jgi:type IV secretory pathway TrbD component